MECATGWVRNLPTVLMRLYSTKSSARHRDFGRSSHPSLHSDTWMAFLNDHGATENPISGTSCHFLLNSGIHDNRLHFQTCFHHKSRVLVEALWLKWLSPQHCNTPTVSMKWYSTKYLARHRGFDRSLIPSLHWDTWMVFLNGDEASENPISGMSCHFSLGSDSHGNQHPSQLSFRRKPLLMWLLEVPWELPLELPLVLLSSVTPLVHLLVLLLLVQLSRWWALPLVQKW
mmetsp:Transcript_116917/g.225527  ORF Transcript_116917/g.225527 Transcript_116917/m.225527 type:complete len:230 (+) Transcript_116917:228-917(+)